MLWEEGGREKIGRKEGRKEGEGRAEQSSRWFWGCGQGRGRERESLLNMRSRADEQGKVTRGSWAVFAPRKKRRVTLKSEPTTPFRPSQSQSSPTSNIKPTTRGKRKSLPTAPSMSPARTLSATKKPHPSPTTPNSHTNKPKRPPAISSLSGSGSAGGVRVPLTSDQKRANHTNSEQRRRDQAQKAFAKLFDLVPELEQEGKLSQMKKLERVVRKIRELEEGNRECRRRIEVVEKGGG